LDGVKTILYVEDHPPAQFLMRAIVGDLLPHKLALAASGESALVSAKSQLFDLYIVDLDLPDTDGLTLAKALCEIHPAPIILVSAYAESIREEQFSGIAETYLTKPLDPDHVAQVIQRTLAGRD
jgi:CheY-like chemotaxis protein